MIAIETIATALPARVLTDAELRAEHPDWDFDRLEHRTGVVARHVAAEGETALDLALQACRELEARNQLHAKEIDALIFCTQSPDYIMPANSCLMQGKLGHSPRRWSHVLPVWRWSSREHSHDLERRPGLRDIRCGTSGARHEQFIIPAGGMRRPHSSETSREVVDGDPEDVYFEETDTRFAIRWKGEYRIDGNAAR